MSGNAFAQDRPEAGPWSRRGRPRRHYGPDPMFARAQGWGGRPAAEDLIALRRMCGGPSGHGRHGRGRGRARRGDVRLALLRLLAEEPRNGYQLIETIEQRSGGRWRPSPGSVYPTLAQLEDEGLISSTADAGGRQFVITDAGREHLRERAHEPDPGQPLGEAGEGAIAELAPLVAGIGKAAWQVAGVGDRSQRERAVELLAQARRGLYRILAQAPDQPEERSQV